MKMKRISNSEVILISMTGIAFCWSAIVLKHLAMLGLSSQIVPFGLEILKDVFLVAVFFRSFASVKNPAFQNLPYFAILTAAMISLSVDTAFYWYIVR
jgi:hypothetical protein